MIKSEAGGVYCQFMLPCQMKKEAIARTPSPPAAPAASAKTSDEPTIDQKIDDQFKNIDKSGMTKEEEKELVKNKEAMKNVIKEEKTAGITSQ